LRFFVTHRRALLDYASSITGSHAEAEDLVQEAWLRFDNACRQRFLEDPLGYLYRIVRNLAFDGKRRTAREAQLIGPADYGSVAEVSADASPSPEMIALYKQEYRLVMEAMAELPERTRIALEMYRFGGCKLREIADYLDISISLAHALVSDGVQHCKRRLGWP